MTHIETLIIVIVIGIGLYGAYNAVNFVISDDIYTHNRLFRYKVKRRKYPTKTTYQGYRKLIFSIFHRSITPETEDIHHVIKEVNKLKSKDRNNISKSKWLSKDEMMVEEL